MSLRELAHSAQQHLQTRAGCAIKRSHVHELLAAAFGYQSWAAFLAESLLADGGAGDPPNATSALLVGRALQLDYPQAQALEMAKALLEFAAEKQLSVVRWVAFRPLLEPEPELILALPDDDDVEDEDWDDGNDDAEPGIDSHAVMRERLLSSPLLLANLEQAAEVVGGELHHLVASLYRCKRPNPYLHEESLKQHVLVPAEHVWVDEYLTLAPRFQKYEKHLKAAALGGVRQAAAEYAEVFESPEFFELAERLTGEVDAARMAKIAPTAQARTMWLRHAAEQGSEHALQQLADAGEAWAQDRLAELGDIQAMRVAAEAALARGDSLRAWVWQYLSLRHGADLTRSTMHAYHDGGQQDGQFYDSDFGGALYVDGDEALALPEMSRAEHREAKAMAQEIFSRAA